MPVQSVDIKVFNPQVSNDGASNGGRQTLVTKSDGVKNSIFPDITSQERADGSVKARKLFFKWDKAVVDATQFSDAFFYCKEFGDSDIGILFKLGTDIDKETDLDWGTNLFVGRVTALDTVNDYIDFVSRADPTAFTDMVRHRGSDGTTETYVGSGLTIAAVSGNTWRISGLDAALFSVGDVLTGYKVISGNESADPANILPRCYAATASTVGSGTFDRTQVTLTPRAAIDFTMTLSLLNTSSYSYSIPELGISGVGDITTDLTVYHPDDPTNSPLNIMVGIPAAAFSGFYENGDTVTLSIESGAMPLWIQRTVDAGQSSVSGVQNLDIGLSFLTA